MRYVYNTYGTCSSQITMDLSGDTVNEINFSGGCHGNAQGISLLAAGQNARSLIAKLEGVKCGGKQTSCPDQLAQALKLALSEEEKCHGEQAQ